MTREERNEYYRAYRAKRKAEGICLRCGKPVKNGHVNCDDCMEIARQEQKLRYRQRVMAQYQEMSNEPFNS